jgi:hypothetical protein
LDILARGQPWVADGLRFNLAPFLFGELVLFPAIRGSGQETIIVAPGTSCRHQIRDGTGRPALHPAEVLRRRLCDP